MNKFLLLTLILTICSSTRFPEHPIITEKFNSEELFHQFYPTGLACYNYSDLIPGVVRETFGPLYHGVSPDWVKKNKLKSLIRIVYREKDTGIAREEYDKYGNLMYQGSGNRKYEKYYRYRFNEKGQISKFYEFFPNIGKCITTCFHYNSNDHIDFLINKDLGDSSLTAADSIFFNYDTSGNTTMAGNKTLIYDNNGNCVEWHLDLRRQTCQATVTHWTGEYDKEGNLINSWNNIGTFTTDSLEKVKIAEIADRYSSDSLLSPSGQLLERTTYGGDVKLSTTYYKYY